MMRLQFDPLVITSLFACIARTSDTSEWRPSSGCDRAPAAGPARPRGSALVSCEIAGSYLRVDGRARPRETLGTKRGRGRLYPTVTPARRRRENQPRRAEALGSARRRRENQPVEGSRIRASPRRDFGAAGYASTRQFAGAAFRNACHAWKSSDVK